MGRVLAISATIIVLGVLVTFLVVWLARLGHRERAAEKGWALKGDLNKRQEAELRAQLDTAASLFQSLTGLDGRFDDMPYIPTKHRDRIAIWLQTYNKKETK